ncbi:MAG: hypothetical protein L6R36_005501 [Xanthoria steineri]|nr:MAG: hypothetical protein L6R36_005501 [Xanthoria steineri]
MSTPSLPISPTRASTLTTNLTSILTRISSATTTTTTPQKPIRLVAVSKLKPANDILALHSPPHSHLHFGENYLQELLAKAAILPQTINWHFIGALQTNKCRPLAEQVGNLWCVESVDSIKKAEELDKGRGRLWENEEAGGKWKGVPLRVCVQVNTSGEAEKSGVPPSEAAALCKYVREKCERLRLQGVMTIGAIARSQGVKAGEENADFLTLREVREQVVRELGMREEELELSMGMSEDFESAIRCGSDEVRVGSTIFGERPPRQDAKIKDEVEEGKS